MDLYPVMPEIMTERITGAVPMKAGELLAARVLQVEGEMLQLMLDSGAVLKTRLLADLKLQKGEELVLQVKGIREGRIEMSVAYRNQAAGNPGNRAGEYGAGKSNGEIYIIEKLIQNNLPVTPGSIREIQRALKQIFYIRDNLTPALEAPLTAFSIDAPIDQIVKWLAGAREAAAAGKAAATGQTAAVGGTVETGQTAAAKEAKLGRNTAEQEKLNLMLRELTGAGAEDVIKLKKFGLRLSLQNLVLSKNLRENKGFPGILLKTFFEEQETVKKEPVPPKEGIIKIPDKEGKGTVKALKDGGGDQSLNRPDDKAEPVDIKALLKDIIRNEKAPPRQKAAAELLEQRAFLLEKALTGQNLCIFPFLFGGRVFECLIKGQRYEGGGGPEQGGIVELVVDMQPPYLGSIKVVIRVCGRNAEFGFFADKEETKSLVERERETLKKGIEGLGFRVNRITCGRMPERKPQTGDVFLDVKV